MLYLENSSVRWGAQLRFQAYKGASIFIDIIHEKFQRGGARLKQGGKCSPTPIPLNAIVWRSIPAFPVYFETYGCQMNVNDTEVAWSILKDAGYKLALSPTEVSSL